MLPPTSGFFPPFPIRRNNRFQHLETAVPIIGNDRYLIKVTTVSYIGNKLHLVRHLRLFPYKETENYNVLSCLNKSQMTMPAVTDTFSECLVPYWGISIQPSLWSITSC